LRGGEERQGEQEDHLVWVDRIAWVRGGEGEEGKGSKKITWSELMGKLGLGVARRGGKVGLPRLTPPITGAWHNRG
jgi:hypothetical protein